MFHRRSLFLLTRSGSQLFPRLSDHESGLRRLAPLLDEVLAEDAVVMLGFLIVVRGERHRKHRHACVEADAHQSFHHGLGNEVMAVDAAIDNESSGCNGGVTA